MGMRERFHSCTRAGLRSQVLSAVILIFNRDLLFSGRAALRCGKNQKNIPYYTTNDSEKLANNPDEL